jgi:hypothetical protein
MMNSGTGTEFRTEPQEAHLMHSQSLAAEPQLAEIRALLTIPFQFHIFPTVKQM